jgi:hypothetical protein
VDDQWIAANIEPELPDVAERQWTPETLGGLVARLADKIQAAVTAGELSREGARRARERISAAMRTIPGVISYSAADEFEPITGTTSTERRDV